MIVSKNELKRRTIKISEKDILTEELQATAQKKLEENIEKNGDSYKTLQTTIKELNNTFKTELNKKYNNIRDFKPLDAEMNKFTIEYRNFYNPVYKPVTTQEEIRELAEALADDLEGYIYQALSGIRFTI